MTKYLMVGGPLHGQESEVPASASVVTFTEFPGMAYHRTHVPLGTVDPNWWTRDLPEPTFVTIMEWHEEWWEPPAVAAIKNAVRDAEERLLG